MENTNYGKINRSMLMVMDGETDMSGLREILDKRYHTVLLDRDRCDIKHIKEMCAGLAAAVICAKAASADNFELLEKFFRDSMTATVPVLIYCTKDEFSIAEECISRGAVNILMPGLPDGIVLNQVANSIKLKDSASFMEIEKMLKELPSNIYLKDNMGRYIFATHYWHHIEHNDDPDWTIRGKTDVDIRKDKENAENAMKADMELLKTGKGTDYIIEINTDGIQEFMEVIKRPVRNDKGNITGIIGLINNVTEQELLKRKLEEKAHMDELTGVGNRHGFEYYIETQPIGEMLPVCIISADCNDLKYINDTYGHLVGDEYIRMTALLIRTVLPANSRLFRTGGDEFIIVIPFADHDTAQEHIKRLKNEEKLFVMKEKPISISYGASCMEEPGDDIYKHIEIADGRMYENKRRYKELNRKR